jgi:alpha-amylase/alpha-mannosidase (GH57 family)
MRTALMMRRLDLVLMWHMHQPDYRDYASGEFMQPWVYLHAIKDYTDMAAHLERHAGVRAVVNLVPVLLDQIEDYVRQFETGHIRDPLLRLLRRDEATPLTDAERRLIIEHCFNAHHEKMVDSYPPYKRLHELRRLLDQPGASAPPLLYYLSDRFFFDLLVWYHLAWTGETVRRDAELVTRLMSKGVSFTFEERLALFNLIGSLLARIVPRYAALAKEGRIELSTTPHFHPLAPLMLDFASAREARPTLPLPAAARYPGGQARVDFHIDSAMREHARRFGAAPAGIWPAEGGISAALADLLGKAGCTWTASGEAVLANSLRASGAIAVSDDWAAQRSRWLYQPWRLATRGPALFFRDDRLSDLIGFEYANWHSRDAALNFVAELDAIAARVPEGGATPLVSVILDGENCWEYYPYNGFYFLEALYGALETHSTLRTVTFKSVIDANQPVPIRLERLVAGSWVYGDFSTWIGSPDKNHAWDLLVAAKQCYNLVIDSGRLSEAERAAAARQLASCESSDWFWWMGDYNPRDAVASFDRLYRDNLARLYVLLKLPVPHTLAVPISRGEGKPETGGTMRRAG